MVKNTFIITAGGIGKRMGSDLPKQFIDICGKPIIIRTIEQLLKYDPKAQVIVTVPQTHVDFFKDLLMEHLINQAITIVVGGEERFHSVRSAVDSAEGEFVWVHDAVRPFVSSTVMQKLADAVTTCMAVIPVIEVKESLRRVEKTESKAVDRSTYRIVQTPQVFERELLRKAYQQAFSNNFTDDASLVESLGHSIQLVEGNSENMKITNPIDLQLAEILVNKAFN